MLRHIILAAFTILPAIPWSYDLPDFIDDERERLGLRESEFFAAVAAKEAARAAGLFSDPAVLHVANMPPIAGRDAIHQFYSNLFRFLGSSVATSEMIHVSGNADLAYSMGSTSNEFSGPHGSIEYEGKYLIVWQKIGGEWMISAYSISSNEAQAR